uniref:Salivary mucin n=1 Tax=Plectus sambesii TaxID=2011161 RepID=A0A914WJ84_9BILA
MQLSAWALALLVVVVVTHVDVVESGKSSFDWKKFWKNLPVALAKEGTDVLVAVAESSKMRRRAIATRKTESSMKQQLYKATASIATTPTTIATSAKTTTATTKSSPKPRSNNDGVSVLAIIGM